MTTHPQDDDFDDCGFDDDDIGEDCGLDNDGQCSQAGTEWCDFECPFRDSELFAGSTAWRIKHAEEV